MFLSGGKMKKIIIDTLIGLGILLGAALLIYLILITMPWSYLACVFLIVLYLCYKLGKFIREK